MARLDFAPLTHPELTRRTAETKDLAGGYAMAVSRRWPDFPAHHAAELERMTTEYDGYLNAALQRVEP